MFIVHTVPNMEINSCRLCTSVTFLTNLYQIDGDVRLDTKLTFCLDVQLHPKDNFPVMICKQCKRKVQKFYKFKKRCLEVDLELKALRKATVETHLEHKHSTIKSEHTQYESIEDNGADFLEDESFYTQEYTDGLRKNKDSRHTELEEVSKTDNWLYSHSDSLQKQREIQNEKLLQCHLCSSTFNTTTQFKHHQKLHGQNMFQNSIESHDFSSTFNSRTELKNQQKVHRQKSFQCEYCPKWFTRAENKLIHTLSHLGIKPLLCEICGQTSTKQQDLRRHMKIHSDEKNYECQTCGKCFKRSGDLHTHLRTHTGARPYHCKLCGKTYTSHSGLRKHNKTHY